MKKKKLIALGLGAMMMSMAVLPVSADDLSVTYNEPQHFKLSIPTGETNLATTKSISVGVNSVNLLANKEIALKMTAGIDDAGAIELSDSSQTDRKAKTTLSLSDGGNVIKKDEIFEKFDSNGTTDLFFSNVTDTDGTTTKAGTYTGKITFTATIQDKP